jgi:hypothetical protein
MRTIGAIQPCYLPWRGFFDFLREVDVFVFLDDVQYTVRDWRNRNRIKTRDGNAVWLTVPVLGGRHQAIKDVRIDNTQPWLRKHLGALNRSYGQLRHFDEYFERLRAVYDLKHEHLSDLDIDLTVAVCRCLGIETEMIRSSTLGCDGAKDNKLLALVRQLGGDRYLSGPSAKDYLRPEIWQRAGIELAYKDYSGYPEYEQISAPFEPGVSIVDLLFTAGSRAPDYIWGELRQRVAA